MVAHALGQRPETAHRRFGGTIEQSIIFVQNILYIQLRIPFQFRRQIQIQMLHAGRPDAIMAEREGVAEILRFDEFAADFRIRRHLADFAFDGLRIENRQMVRRRPMVEIPIPEIKPAGLFRPRIDAFPEVFTGLLIGHRTARMADHNRHIWFEINLFRRLPVFFIGQAANVAVRMRLADFTRDFVDEIPDMIGKDAVGRSLRPQIRLALRTFTNPCQPVVRHNRIDFYLRIGVEIFADVVAPCLQQIRIAEAEMAVSVRDAFICECALSVHQSPELGMLLLVRLHKVEAMDDDHGSVAAESRATEPQRVVFILFKQAEPWITVAETRRTRQVDFRKLQIFNGLQNNTIFPRPVEADAAELLQKRIDAAQRPLVLKGGQFQLRIVHFVPPPWIAGAGRRRVAAVLSRDGQGTWRRLDAKSVRRQRFRFDAMSEMDRPFARNRLMADRQLDAAQPTDELLHLGGRQLHGIRRVFFDDDMRIGLSVRPLESCLNRRGHQHRHGREHRQLSVYHGNISNFNSFAMTARPSALFFLLPRVSTVASRSRRTSCVWPAYKRPFTQSVKSKR